MRAELARASGDLPSAIQAYRAALAGADEDSYLLARLGSALDEAGEHTQAQEVLNDALERDPDSEAVWLARAELFERSGATIDAFASLEHAAQVAPDSARAPLALAKLLERQGQNERARAVLADHRKRLAQAGADVYRMELDAALLSGEPDAVFAATLPYRMGAPPKAAERLNRAAQLLLDKERPALALRVLELLPAAQREAPLELRALDKAGSVSALEAWLVMHEPNSPDARIKAARSALLVGKVARATAILESDRLLHPETPGLLLLSAEIASARGQYLVAADQFARVPHNTSVGSEAKEGLTAVLGALGLEALAAELNETPVPLAAASPQ
ncbi:MAG TPA: tetratricopeptide repeat protein [Polyangiales bacterium]|nr:tetratricopeptide repeat protein [Polyangiales bacterium]